MENPAVFKNTIDSIYNSITGFSNIDNSQSIEKNLISFESILYQYENVLTEESKKQTGSFYTHKSIIKFMLRNAIGRETISENPYIKVLDPSCGSGYFLIEVYCILKEILMENIETINAKYPNINLNAQNIHEHIIEHNIFGADTDEYAVKISIISLMLNKPDSRKIPNIICCDSVINWEETLLENRKFWDSKFDFIVGNPPYIGHKKLTGKYRLFLNSIYGDIFKDKADLSFCFIKSSIDRLKEGGRLCFITSRYFMESPSGMALREYIKNNCIVQRIIDFYGVRIMKGISVDPVIVFFIKSTLNNCNIIKVAKAEMALKDIDCESLFSKLEGEENKYFRTFIMPQDQLKHEGWILCPDNEMSIIKKIENTLKIKLSDLCLSFQGIITGCDKAFVVDDSIIREFNIEKDITRKWIKNSNIKKYKVTEGSLYIMYSDSIDNEKNYPNALSYISNYKDRLEKRRECISGVRKWYQLQWGRDSILFESEKIVFPYKSSCNRFAVDKGSYSSADVYGMIIKNEYKNRISYDFLTGILNSKLYEFYFKSFGKKLGDDLYDYYPNTVMRLIIPDIEDSYIADKVRYIKECSEEDEIKKIIADIDIHIYKMFKLTDDEINIIDGRVRQ